MSLNSKKITTLRSTFEKCKFEFDGEEAWRARDLMGLLGYKTWENFRTAINRAWTACKNADRDPRANFLVSDGSAPWDPSQIFRGATKVSRRGPAQEDVIVTRYGAYLIALSGDERIEQIAFAKRYFATQTRKQELLEQQLLDDDRVKAHGKFAKSEAELREVVYERGGNEHGFKTVRNRGHKAYFNKSPDDVAKGMGVPKDRDYVDFMDPINVKALDLAQSITRRRAEEEGLDTVAKIAKTNAESNKNVRKAVVKSGIIPEKSPAVEDIRRVETRLAKRQTKQLKGAK